VNTTHEMPNALRVFTVIFVIAVMAGIWGCVPDNPPSPDGCPLPAYKVGDIVLVEEVYISTITARRVVGCGEILYDVTTNVDIDGELVRLKDVPEARITPYEPAFE